MTGRGHHLDLQVRGGERGEGRGRLLWGKQSKAPRTEGKRRKRLTGGIGRSRCGGEEGGEVIGGKRCR